MSFSQLGAINRFRYGLFVTDIANKSVHINRIAQDAFIEVNENGNKISYDSGEISNNYIRKFKYNIYLKYNRTSIMILYLYITNIKNLWFYFSTRESSFRKHIRLRISIRAN